MQRVRVHAVLKSLHLLDDFLQRRVFDAHVVYGVEQRDAIRETLLHLLKDEVKKREGNNSDNAEVYQFQYICFNMYLYRFEHELSVVERSEVFGDVKANRANGGEEMQHHWDHLDKNTDYNHSSQVSMEKKLLCESVKPVSTTLAPRGFFCAMCVSFTHLHLSSLSWSSRFSSLGRSVFYAVLTTMDQNLHHIQRLGVCNGLNSGKCAH